HGFAPAPADTRTVTPDEDGFFFLNGVLQTRSRGEPLPAGVTLRSMQQVLAEEPQLLSAHLGTLARSQDEPLVALNTAFMAGGYVLHVGAGVSYEAPVPLVFASQAAQTPTASHPRNLVIAE